jgi:hypothetical protein
MYRSAPFSDIAYVFIARSNAWKTKKDRNWPWNHAVEIADGYRLQRVIKLQQLRMEKSLEHWDFLRNQRGEVSRRSDLQERGVWAPLQRLLESNAPGLRAHFGSAWTGRGRRHPVFLSYASSDKRRVQSLYESLSRQGIDVWLDRHQLQPGDDWDREIQHALKSSKAFVVCFSRDWVRRGRNSYAKKEFAMALEEASGRKRYFFPVVIQKCNFPRTLRYQFADLTGPDSDMNCAKLARMLRAATVSDSGRGTLS